MHGGGAPQVREAARQRLLEAADSAAAELVKIMKNQKTPGPARVPAINSLLDRAGVSTSSKLEVTGADGKPLHLEIMERLIAGRELARGVKAEGE
jgi:hypothetical protein